MAPGTTRVEVKASWAEREKVVKVAKVLDQQNAAARFQRPTHFTEEDEARFGFADFVRGEKKKHSVHLSFAERQHPEVGWLGDDLPGCDAARFGNRSRGHFRGIEDIQNHSVAVGKHLLQRSARF